MSRWWIWVTACVAMLAQSAPLLVDDAFELQVGKQDNHTLGVQFNIAPDHFLYQDIMVRTDSKDIEIGRLRRPAATVMDLPGLGQKGVYTVQLDMRLPILVCTSLVNIGWNCITRGAPVKVIVIRLSCGIWCYRWMVSWCCGK